MKKSLIIVLFILLWMSGQAQQQNLSVSTETGLIIFERLYEFPDLKADELYNKTKLWFAESFKSGAKQINSDEKPVIITASFVSNYWNNMMTTAPYRHNLKIKFKDGAIKIIVTNIESMATQYPVNPNNAWVKKGQVNYGGMWKKAVAQADENITSLAESLKKAIESKSEF